MIQMSYDIATFCQPLTPLLAPTLEDIFVFFTHLALGPETTIEKRLIKVGVKISSKSVDGWIEWWIVGALTSAEDAFGLVTAETIIVEVLDNVPKLMARSNTGFP